MLLADLNSYAQNLFVHSAVAKMSWEKNSKKKPSVHNIFCFLVNFVRHTGPMVTTGHQVHRWVILASSGRNELGKKF